MDEKPSQQAEDNSSRCSSSTISSRLRLGGIKFSEMQAQVSFLSPPDQASLGELLSALSRNKINLNRLLLNRGTDSVCDFSIYRHDYLRHRVFIEQIFDSCSIPSSCDQPIGIITLFPHGSELIRLIGVLETVERYELPITGIYSSLSAISLCIGYDQLDRVADLLQERFELPAGHSPFRYEPSELDQQLRRGSGRKVETVAQYWEPRIKIYGSTLKQGVRSYTLSFPARVLGSVLSQLSTVCLDLKFQMFSLTPDGNGNYTMLLVIDPQNDLESWDFFGRQLSGILDLSVTEHNKVDILYLHGPHFQDRYGVASKAVAALDRGTVDFTCLNCTGTSIFLVTEENDGEKALESLSEVFIVP